MYNQDSPLSTTASIAGILTLLTALLAAVYVRFTYLANADKEYFSVKASLSWYKTESEWMEELVRSTGSPASSLHGFDAQPGVEREHGGGRDVIDGIRREGTIGAKEKEMYTFIIDQLFTIEKRLLECLAEAEDTREKLQNASASKRRWTVTPWNRDGSGGNRMAVAWLGVRGRALELVRQRDALGGRVLFAQMSLISSRVKDQESRARKRDEAQRERMERVENLVCAQTEKLDRLEDLVYRVMHRERVEEGSPRYEEGDYARERERGGNLIPV